MLAKHDVDYERRDYFGNPFTEDQLRALFEEIGVQPSEVLSKRSKAYKELDLANRDVSEHELLRLMTEHPTLIRRPIIVADAGSVIGFNQEKIEELIQR